MLGYNLIRNFIQNFEIGCIELILIQDQLAAHLAPLVLQSVNPNQS